MNFVHLVLLTAMGLQALSVQNIEDAFMANYENASGVLQDAEAAQFQLNNASGSFLPIFQLNQNSSWKDFQTLSFQATAGISYNIFDTSREYQYTLATLGLKSAQFEKELDKSRSLFNLRIYLQALNTYEIATGLLSGLEADVRKSRPHWLLTTPANKFAPNEIDAYQKYLDLADTHKNIELQSAKIRKQISKWTKLTLDQLGSEKIQFPGDVALPSINTQKCIDESVAVKRAELRLEQEKLSDALLIDATPKLSVSANLTGNTNPVSGQPAVTGQVGINLSIPIPTTAPVAGNVQVSAGTAGVTQSSSLTFPNPFRSAEPRGAYWAEKNLNDTRETVVDDLAELLRSRATLEETLKLDKQRLDWGNRSYREANGADELARLGGRFALMGLKVRALNNHLNYQINGLNITQLCQLNFTYAPREVMFFLEAK